MPFGLVMTQDVFQQKMEAILESCSGTLGIADDVAVFGRSEAEHDANLHNLMRVSREHGLVFNSKKCGIKAPQISFFGTIYDEKGVHPDPKKIEDIQMIPTPESTTELQEFLSIVTYMGSFVLNLSQNTAILRELLKKDADFQWSQMHQKAFELVKSSICKETTLAYFDRDKESVIQVDATGKGLEAVLLQDIAYASKSLTDAEKRYANIKRELLAVVFGSESFHTCVRKKVHRGKRSQAIGDDPAEESYRGATKTAENVVTNTTLRYDDQVPSRQRITSRRWPIETSKSAK